MRMPRRALLVLAAGATAAEFPVASWCAAPRTPAALPCQAAARCSALTAARRTVRGCSSAIAIRTLWPPIWCGDLETAREDGVRARVQPARPDAAAASGGIFLDRPEWLPPRHRGRRVPAGHGPPPQPPPLAPPFHDDFQGFHRRRHRRRRLRRRRRRRCRQGTSRRRRRRAGAEAVAGDEAMKAPHLLGRLPSDQRRVGLGLRSGGHASRSSSGEGRRRARVELGAARREATISGLTPGTAYRFSVSVASASGELGPRSGRSSRRPPPPACRRATPSAASRRRRRSRRRSSALDCNALVVGCRSCPRRRATRRGSPSGSGEQAGQGGWNEVRRRDGGHRHPRRARRARRLPVPRRPPPRRPPRPRGHGVGARGARGRRQLDALRRAGGRAAVGAAVGSYYRVTWAASAGTCRERSPFAVEVAAAAAPSEWRRGAVGRLRRL